MNLTSTQLATFKAAILGDVNLASFRAAGNQGAIADYYNAAGAGTIWRPDIGVAELNTAIVWSEFIAATVARQNGYFAMCQGSVVDATNANIRAGFSTIFSGTQSLTNLTALAQRTPTRFEALFAVSQVTPVYNQIVSPADVALALGS